MVTAPHIASPGPAAEPCNVYTGGSIVARVSCVPGAVCKRRTASPRLCSCASPRSRESPGGLCGAHATFVGPTLPLQGDPRILKSTGRLTDVHSRFRTRPGANTACSRQRASRVKASWGVARVLIAGFDTAKAASMTRAACRTRRITLSGPLNAARRGPGGDRYSGHSRPLRGSAKFFCCNWGGVAQLVRAAES